MNRKKHLLHVVLSLGVGGLERVVVNLMNSLVDEYDLTLCCIEDKGELAHLLDDRIEIVELKKGSGLALKTSVALAKVIKERQVDLIHSHNLSAHFYSALARALTGFSTPLVHTKHGRNQPGDKKKVLMSKLSSLFSSVVVCVSHDARTVCLEKEGVPSKKVKVIQNGIPMEGIAKKAEYQLTQGKVRFIHVGRLVAEKNQAEMICLFEDFIHDHPEAELDIVGEGYLYEELKGLVENSRHADKIRLLGKRSDVGAILQEYDCFLMNSSSEGLPLSILEAMAAGLPIVSSSAGDIGVVVEDEVSGLLFQVGEGTSMLHAMERVVASASLRKSLGEKAFQRVKEKFSNDGMVKRYRRFYQNLAV